MNPTAKPYSTEALVHAYKGYLETAIEEDNAGNIKCYANALKELLSDFDEEEIDNIEESDSPVHNN